MLRIKRSAAAGIKNLKRGGRRGQDFMLFLYGKDSRKPPYIFILPSCTPVSSDKKIGVHLSRSEPCESVALFGGRYGSTD